MKSLIKIVTILSGFTWCTICSAAEHANSSEPVHFFLVAVPDSKVANLRRRAGRQEDGGVGGAIGTLGAGLEAATGPAANVAQILSGVLGGNLVTILAGSTGFIPEGDFREGVTDILHQSIAPAFAQLVMEFNKTVQMALNATTSRPQQNQLPQANLNQLQQANLNQLQQGQFQFQPNYNQLQQQLQLQNQQQQQKPIQSGSLTPQQIQYLQSLLAANGVSSGSQAPIQNQLNSGPQFQNLNQNQNQFPAQPSNLFQQNRPQQQVQQNFNQYQANRPRNPVQQQRQPTYNQFQSIITNQQQPQNNRYTIRNKPNRITQEEQSDLVFKQPIGRPNPNLPSSASL